MDQFENLAPSTKIPETVSNHNDTRKNQSEKLDFCILRFFNRLLIMLVEPINNISAPTLPAIFIGLKNPRGYSKNMVESMAKKVTNNSNINP